MSSTKAAYEILDTLLERIEECLMSYDHDTYLETIIDSILATDTENVTHQMFKHIITSLYQQMTCGEHKTESVVFGEIAWLLETYYKGDETLGYNGAFYDATRCGGEGLIKVLPRILAMILSVTLTKRITYLICSSIDPLDWHLRETIVKAILDRFDTLLKPELKTLQPSQLVPHLEDLIMMLSQPILYEIIIPINPPQAETLATI